MVWPPRKQGLDHFLFDPSCRRVRRICLHRHSHRRKPNRQAMSKFTESIVRIATAEIGVRESPKNSNCGPRVNEYKAATWLDSKQSWPWCAAFVDWVVQKAMAECGVKETPTFQRPRTAGAWDLIRWSLSQDNTTSTKHRPQASDIAPGDIVVFTFSHVGIAASSADSSGSFATVEGNTDENGSREGGGVYRKTRGIQSVKARIRFKV